jgi:hypothetical protein
MKPLMEREWPANRITLVKKAAKNLPCGHRWTCYISLAGHLYRRVVWENVLALAGYLATFLRMSGEKRVEFVQTFRRKEG